MNIELTDQQKQDWMTFHTFVNQKILPFAERYDQQERISVELVEDLAKQGYLGALVPQAYGGPGMDILTYGLLNEEIGRGCSSARSLITVHNMVVQAIVRWGNKAQKAYWLPKLARGQAVAAFALTEPDVGCDAKNIETTAIASGNAYILSGCKKWVTYGQNADVFLVFARYENQPTAFLVERNSPGFSSVPIFGMLGVRGSLLATLHLDACQIPKENLLGCPGAGFSWVASSALHYGRYSVAWGCVGIAQACLEASVEYTSQRKQFAAYLKDHQLIRGLITEMLSNVHAARLLCHRAGSLEKSHDPRAIAETSIAKYFASTIATRVASDAVQIHGANGCSSDYPLQRYLRDAKIMEIIEGSTQMQQLTIAEYAYQAYSVQKEKTGSSEE